MAMAAVMEPWVQAFHRCPLISALNEAWHVLHVARRSESTENTENADLLTCSQGVHGSLLEMIFLMGITQSAVRKITPSTAIGAVVTTGDFDVTSSPMKIVA